ncbi:uncharacterized protein LOC128599542 isoform X3 [Ictalurus furcatus]|uniref:uncharacterized protein LOC128599542 isoform X3 n=1 Tax=Ictalurus furcatus TaxID=66913 RepID=UPI002350F497|nr:uncharacterized protein LOC128599542 isoform X3 [Ictalurus furcatus]XP_053467217.1 uncharacterized protein LOC128599542 isoform X3 [Ictalurus furcatus]
MECVYQLKIVHDASSYIPKCCNQFFFEELLSVLTYSYQINELSLYTETKLLCAVLGEETMKTLYLFTLTLTGVLTQVSKYGVNYPDNQICAVRGFSVSIPCTYFYPTSNPNIQVTQMLWCSMNSNRDVCINPPYVYNSALNTTSDFEYAGDNKSDCTLLIHNVQFSYSGEYRFRFITDVTGGRWTGVPGPTLQVADLKVSLIRLSGNGTLKQGDSLNLTCDVNCTQSSSQFVWSKNNERLPESGPVLHFPAVTVRDSGNYTCTWKTNMTSGSETISLLVEGENPERDFAQWHIWIIVLVIVVVILVIVAAVINHRRKRVEAQEENSGKGAEKAQQVGENTHDKPTKPQLNIVPQLDDETLHTEEVTYATVFVKDKKPEQGRVHTERQEEDDSVIYSTVKNT